MKTKSIIFSCIIALAVIGCTDKNEADDSDAVKFRKTSVEQLSDSGKQQYDLLMQAQSKSIASVDIYTVSIDDLITAKSVEIPLQEQTINLPFKKKDVRGDNNYDLIFQEDITTLSLSRNKDDLQGRLSSDKFNFLIQSLTKTEVAFLKAVEAPDGEDDVIDK